MCMCYNLFHVICVFREFSMLVEGHLVEWLLLAKCVTLLKYCVNKIKINKKSFISNYSNHSCAAQIIPQAMSTIT